MKKFITILTGLVFGAICIFAHADAVYPYANPTYIPNADNPVVTISAPSSTAVVMTTLGIGTTSVRITGTCTSLAAAFQGSNDGGANWTALNLYPIATGTTAPTAVASVSATGFWKANTSGMNKVRVNVTALTASCSFKLLGSPHGFNGTTF